jgi:hypothetical protein
MPRSIARRSTRTPLWFAALHLGLAGPVRSAGRLSAPRVWLGSQEFKRRSSVESTCWRRRSQQAAILSASSRRPFAAARCRHATRVQRVSDLAQASPLGPQRLDQRQDVGGELERTFFWQTSRTPHPSSCGTRRWGCLSRRGFGGGDRAWRPCIEKARRRVDGAVRLSSCAGERRRARCERGAGQPARGCRNQRQKPRVTSTEWSSRRRTRPRVETELCLFGSESWQGSNFSGGYGRSRRARRCAMPSPG